MIFKILFVIVPLLKISYISSHNWCKCYLEKQTITIKFCNVTKFENFDFHCQQFVSFRYIKNLEATNNSINTISKDFFQNLTHLETLNLDSNNISYIENDSFKDLINLKTLSIENNKLKQINNKAFVNLAKLKDLFIDDNQIDTIEDESFKDLINLETLSIENNRLKSINNKAFANLINLKDLLIDYNQIDTIEDESFKDLINLETLSIENNQLKSINNKQFAKLTKLEVLFIDDNQIDTIEDESFKDLINLETLSVANNQLKKISNKTFAKLNNLKELYIGDNLIDTIEDYAFKDLNSLHELELQNNQISKIQFGLFNINFPNLSFVNLSHNRLIEIELWPLYLKNVEYVDLRYNRINNFTNNFGWFFANSSNVKVNNRNAVIDLSHNYITSFDDRTVQQYGVCNPEDYKTFMNYIFDLFLLYNNPINCNCNASKRLLFDSRYLLDGKILNKSWCANDKFKEHSILSFGYCKSDAQPIEYEYCKIASSTSSTVFTSSTSSTVFTSSTNRLILILSLVVTFTTSGFFALISIILFLNRYKIKSLLWPNAKGVYLTLEMIKPANIISEKKSTKEENENEKVGYNTIDFIDSDYSSEHIYFDIQ